MALASVKNYEQLRLRKLKDYRILDTAPDQFFDEIVKLGASIAGCEIGLVSLLDENRQWFKAKLGLDANQTERCHSICDHAIRTPEPLIVPDASRDSRFMDLPLVTGLPNVRFYAGFPLITSDGFAIGTLCFVSSASRSAGLGDIQIKQLKLLARQVIAHLEFFKSQTLLTESENDLLKQSEVALLGLATEGLIHEVGNHLNILSGLISYSQKLNEDPELTSKSELTKCIHQAGTVSGQLNELLRSAAALSKNERMGEYSNVLLSDVVDMSLRLMNRGEKLLGIQIRNRIPTDLHVFGSRIQLAQVLTNLLQNSSSAIQDQTFKWIELGAKVLGSSVEITITDSGPGIRPEIREKIFQPFYSTKDSSGIGIFLIQNIIEKHGGKFRLDSEAENTSFIVELPVIT